MSTGNIPSNLLYSKEHEWLDTTSLRIGVTDFAQNALGDLTYVEMPTVGDELEEGGEFGSLESTKSVSPLYLPVAGTIKAINENLEDHPELINQAPYSDGWIVELEALGDTSTLLNAEAYAAFLETL